MLPTDNVAADDSTEVLEEDEERLSGKGWSVPDRKAMIGIFGQFVNPRVLWNHEKVYQALLKQLENGDSEVQKLALKALLTWKQAGVKPYAERAQSEPPV